MQHLFFLPAAYWFRTSHFCPLIGSQLCSICYSYWRRTGLMRSTIGPTRRPAHGHGANARDDSALFNKGAAKPNPPKDMNLDQVRQRARVIFVQPKAYYLRQQKCIFPYIRK